METDIVILDQTKCMSIQNSKNGRYSQCSHRRKVGEYCKRHSSSKHLKRIDDSLKEKNIQFKYEQARTLLIEDEDIYIRHKRIEKPISCTIDEQLQKVSGPAYNNICISHDDIDSISLETLWKYNDKGEKVDACEFDKKLIFSYRDENGFVRCFNIKSLKEILDSGTIINPITGTEFDDEVLSNMKEKIRILEENNLLTYDRIILSPTDELNCRITKVFQLFDKLDIFMETKWFIELDLTQVIRIYEETRNMWKAFTTDNPTMSNNILNGKNPFNGMTRSMDIIDAKNKLLDVFEGFVTNGTNEQSKLTGAIIVIGGFAYVSEPVKDKFKDFLVFN